ncbi:MAG TPA: zinc ribbon domain-containing protein, partial [Bryobacteraceae bacterium]|nr:zinc ribbon domain-containing protein [Bryobacteraceae bacterium]
MPEFCTCGAQLPPDARFCHRCGKPQREEIIPESFEPREVAPPAPQPTEIATAALNRITPPRLNFHNATAVRIALLLASLASLLSALPVMAAGLLGLVIWWLTAGFLSVYVYRRRTGQFLTVDNGLRMGGITGLLGATITSVVFTISVVPLIRGGGIATLYEQQFRKMYANDPSVDQAIKILQSPSGLALFVVIALLFFFLIITFLCTAGGALGAKLVGGV